MPNEDINKARVLGEISDDPQSRFIGDGAEVCNFNVKTVYSAQGKDHPQWHRCVAWRELAEQCCDLKAGDRVQVDGRLQTRVWENKDGVKQKTTEIIADKVTLVEPVPKPAPAPQPATNESDDLPF